MLNRVTVQGKVKKVPFKRIVGHQNTLGWDLRASVFENLMISVFANTRQANGIPVYTGGSR